ncbi:hypothetical protein ACFSQ7_05805 [Paenibacillus rhizoplanae]
MNDFAEGLIALPGGSGTLEEIFLKSVRGTS